MLNHILGLSVINCTYSISMLTTQLAWLVTHSMHLHAVLLTFYTWHYLRHSFYNSFLNMARGTISDTGEAHILVLRKENFTVK